MNSVKPRTRTKDASVLPCTNYSKQTTHRFRIRISWSKPSHWWKWSSRQMSSVLLRTFTFVDLPIFIISAESRSEQRYTLIFASLSDWKLHTNLTSAVRSYGHVTMPLFLQDDTLFILFLWTVLFFAVNTTNKIYSWHVILCIHSYNKSG